MVLWGRATSSNVMKVIWTLEETGVAYERRDAGLTFGVTGTPEYRAMNPTGLVPTWQEGEFTMFESNAICRHVCSAHAAGTTLWPKDARARARVDQWMDVQQTRLNRPQSLVFQGLIRTVPEQRDIAGIGRAVAEAGEAWALLDEALAHHPFATGDDLTLADVAWGVHVHRWFTMPIDRPHAPHLRAWYDRLLTRPVYRATCAGPVI